MTSIVFPTYLDGQYSAQQEANLRHISGYAPQFYLWGAPSDVGDKRKVPYNPATQNFGSVKDAASSGTLDEALSSMRKHRFGGVGPSMLTAADDFIGIDLDSVLQDGVLCPIGVEAFEHFKGTYFEISPSGTGIRIFTLGRIPPGAPKGSTAIGQVGAGEKPIKFEVYSSQGAGRFLRATGAVVSGSSGIVAPAQRGIDWLAGVMVAAKGAAPEKVKAAGPDKASELSLDTVFDLLVELQGEVPVTDIIAAMKAEAIHAPRGKLAEALRGSSKPWNGDESSADFFLCCWAIRKKAGHADDVADLWLGTGLGVRPKAKQKGYRDRTIKKAALDELARLQANAGKVGKAAQPWREIEGMASVPEALQVAGERLLERKGGVLAPTRENVVLLLRHTPDLRGIFWFDEFRQATMRTAGIGVLDSRANCTPGVVADDDFSRLGLYLSRVHSMSLQIPELRLAIYAAARDNRRNPVQERLRELHTGWDRQPRLNTWIERHCMPAPGQGEEYLALIGRLFFIQAVARIMVPASHADCLLIACGPGGGRKSSMFRALADAIGPGLFCDTSFDLSDPVAVVQTCGRFVLVELAELDSMRRARDVNAIKAALSSRSDSYRRPYSSETEDRARAFTFCGSSNEDAWITDPSGGQGRRFWPFQTLSSKNHPMNLAALEAEAGHLWAEAVAAYDSGESWFIDADKPEHAAASRQWDAQLGNRVVVGPWDERLDAYLLAQVGYESEWSAQDLAGRIGYVKAQEEDASFQKFANMLRGRGLVKKKTAVGNLWTMTPEAHTYLQGKFGSGGSPSGAASTKRSGLGKVAALRSV